jgi:YNFM family putative membrane transporter
MVSAERATPPAPSGPAPASAPFPYRGALVALVVGTIGALSAIYCTQPILPELSADFHVDAPTAGLTLSLMTAALAVALLIYGPLSDRVGRRPVLIGSCLGMAVPSFGAMLAPTFSWLLVCRLGQGVLAGGISAVALAYIADEFPRERIGLAVGTYTSAMVAAALVGRVGGGLLTAWLSWRVMFGVFGGLAVIGAALFATLLPASRRFNRSGTLRSAYAGGGVHLRNPRMLGIFAVGFALLFSFMGFFTYLSYHLAGPPFRLPLWALTLIYGVYAMGVIGPFAGNLSTRVGRRPVLVGGLIILAAGLLLTLATRLPVVIAGCVVLALGMFCAQSVANAYVSDQAHQARGAASGFYLFCYYVGGTLGVQLVGLLWNAWGWPPVVATCATVALGAAAIAARFCRDSVPAPRIPPEGPV